MKKTHFLETVVLGATLMTAAGIASGGCSAPDPGEIPNDRPPGSTFDAGNGNPGPGPGPGEDAGGDPPDSGTPDTGPAPLTGAFVGAGAFTPNQPGTPTSNASHGTADGNPTGLECLSCHKTGGAAAGRIFAMGGTVYTQRGQTTPAGGVEVRVLPPAGAGEPFSLYTNATGNFFATSDKVIPSGSKIGVRDAVKTPLSMADLLMDNGAADDGNCSKSGCHVGGTGQAKIYLAP